LQRLWERASEGEPNSRRGGENTRDEFWRLVRDESESDVRLVKSILEKAGFDFDDTTKAPRLREIGAEAEASRGQDDERAAEFDRITKVLSAEANILSREGRVPSETERANRDVVSRRLDIDHKISGSYAKGMEEQKADELRLWLKPVNLQFMLGDDNRFHKGDRYHR